MVDIIRAIIELARGHSDSGFTDSDGRTMSVR